MQQLAIEYFDFEQDFMEDNIRCIPMIVRFKLDACGIKLKLKEWSKMILEEREQLANLSIDTTEDLIVYKTFVQELIYKSTGENATLLPPTYYGNNGEILEDILPAALEEKLRESKMNISLTQWRGLTVLQRFALLKLTRPGHENKNFPKAMKEFGLA
jgi:hypothetical protein